MAATKTPVSANVLVSTSLFCKAGNDLGQLVLNNCRQLSVSDSITVDDNAVRELLVDLVVLAESIAHPDFQVVRKLLSSGLKHHLAVVPVGRGREREGEGGREGRERGGRGEGGRGDKEGEREGEERGGEGGGRQKGCGHQILHTKSVGSCAHTSTSYLVMVGLVLAMNPPTDRPRCDESW